MFNRMIHWETSICQLTTVRRAMQVRRKVPLDREAAANSVDSLCVISVQSGSKLACLSVRAFPIDRLGRLLDRVGTLVPTAPPLESRFREDLVSGGRPWKPQRNPPTQLGMHVYRRRLLLLAMREPSQQHLPATSRSSTTRQRPSPLRANLSEVNERNSPY